MQVGRLFQAVEHYMQLRPRVAQPALRPFFESRGDTDAAAASDSGGASFLGQARPCRSHERGKKTGCVIPSLLCSTSCLAVSMPCLTLLCARSQCGCLAAAALSVLPQA
jgi:hypothetical protein